jgi:ubiquinone/menaquinone biosynthesis C-methylase UbiE
MNRVETPIGLDRKEQEREFHNRLRAAALANNPAEYAYLKSNKKFYSADRASRRYVEDWLERHASGKKVLDYCCGNGKYSFLSARYAAEVVGIDISDVSVENCRNRATTESGLATSPTFRVMDAEQMTFADGSFDIALCMGVLHHLDLPQAFKELSRVIRPDGHVICAEPLRHNPVFQLYRRMTPHLRTEFEMHHILGMSDLRLARRYFQRVEARCFHLATLAAVPFRNMPFFSPLLSGLERIDDMLLKLPLIRTQAWMVVFVLSEPIRR